MTRVLVLDDDVVIAELMRVVLEDVGLHVTTRTTAQDLPAGPFDKVVTDLIGIAVYSRDEARDWVLTLADRYPGIPLIVATAHREALDDASYLGAEVILKPFDLDRFVSAVTS